MDHLPNGANIENAQIAAVTHPAPYNIINVALVFRRLNSHSKLFSKQVGSNPA
ncbi:MAG TPA: hypothetical protein VN038_09410 [Dyadobacter sp.]|nr:hypothetical protein [Dyadobacter sp.]